MKIKTILIIAGAVALILFAIWVNSLVVNNRILKADKLRLQENQQQLLTENARTIQLELSLKEFKKSMGTKIDSILKVAEIASKQVKSVTTIHNYYIDSSKTIIRTTPTISKNDTIYPFIDIKDCFAISGYMRVIQDKPELNITERKFNNGINLIGYWQRPHKFWFLKWGKKEYQIYPQSDCGELRVKKIEIVKKK